MKIKFKTFSLIVLPLGFSLVLASCGKAGDSASPLSREEIKEQLAKGKITPEEAQVEYARAARSSKNQPKVGAKSPDKEAPRLSPELQAFGKELREKVEKGELTGQQAKDQWLEATGKSNAPSGTANVTANASPKSGSK